MRFTKKIAALAAALTVAGSLGFASLGVVGGATASAQSTSPRSVADCSNWKSYGFKNKTACITFVANNATNGYGGGNGGNGGDIGSIGRFIRTVLQAIVQFIRSLFSAFF